MTRHKLLNEIRNLQKLVKNHDGSYNKLMLSGKLVETHYDYGVGFYDVSIYHIELMKNGEMKHYCRVWFGTIDDGDFGSWNELKTKEKAIEMVENVAKRFDTFDICPDLQTLNNIFQDLGVYFCHE